MQIQVVIYHIAEDFYGIKLSSSPAVFVFTRDKLFTNAVKVTISTKHRRKNSWIKFLPIRAGGEISENFLLAKISCYTVLFGRRGYIIFFGHSHILVRYDILYSYLYSDLVFICDTIWGKGPF